MGCVAISERLGGVLLSLYWVVIHARTLRHTHTRSHIAGSCDACTGVCALTSQVSEDHLAL